MSSAIGELSSIKNQLELTDNIIGELSKRNIGSIHIWLQKQDPKSERLQEQFILGEPDELLENEIKKFVARKRESLLSKLKTLAREELLKISNMD